MFTFKFLKANVNNVNNVDTTACFVLFAYFISHPNLNMVLVHSNYTNILHI